MIRARAVFAFAAVLAGCSGNRTTHPSLTPPPSAPKPVEAAPPKPAPEAPPPPPPAAPSPEAEPDSKPVRAAILKQIDLHNGEIRECYDRHAERDPHGGRATLRFVVAPSGEVVSIADDGSTLEKKAVVACISRVIAAQKFPTWNGKAVTIVAPFDFQPNHY